MTRGRAFMALAAAALAGACAQRSATAPAAVEVTSGAKPGKFVWHDLVTDDVAACRRFYGSLLGWEFEETSRLGRGYVVARLEGVRVAGLVSIEARGVEKPSQWLGYVSVPDVDASVEAVKGAGGRTLVAPVDVAAGRAAVVADPQGAPLGLVRLAQGDPPDEASPQEGRFFWMEYFARDPAPALVFYTALLGYRSEVREQVAGLSYHVLLDARPRAGLLPVPQAGMRPAWLPYVMVADPAGLAAQAESLGGAVLFAPRSDVRKGTLAIVADPSGAPIALQKWPIS